MFVTVDGCLDGSLNKWLSFQIFLKCYADIRDAPQMFVAKNIVCLCVLVAGQRPVMIPKIYCLFANNCYNLYYYTIASLAL